MHTEIDLHALFNFMLNSSPTPTRVPRPLVIFVYKHAISRFTCFIRLHAQFEFLAISGSTPPSHFKNNAEFDFHDLYELMLNSSSTPTRVPRPLAILKATPNSVSTIYTSSGSIRVLLQLGFHPR